MQIFKFLNEKSEEENKELIALANQYKSRCEDKETKTIVKTTAVPVTSPKTRPERWSFF